MLDRLEAALQSALEGVARLLPGKLHPLELAAQLRAAMDTSQVISTETGYVANVYRVLLNPEDLEPLRELQADIGAELATHLSEYAGQRGYGCSPRITVKIESDEGTARGSARVESDFDREPLSAALKVVTGAAPEMFIVRGEAQLGRATDCEVHLADATVSRHHARLQWTYQGYVLHDLNSRNGTLVNGENISEQLLRAGDLIQVGNVQLRFSFRSE